MRSPFAESPEFQRLLRADPGADLIKIALEIARDAYPQLDASSYEDRIEALAVRARERCGSVERPRQVLGQINWILFVEERFQGNTSDYYDPRNSYLNEVLDRKTGIPITLSLIYWRLAERLGLAVAGLNLPAHFMLRVGPAESPVFVDPFHEGVMLDRDGCLKQISRLAGRPVALADDHFSPSSTAVIVARMLRNLKSIYLRGHDYPSALPVQRRLAALEPESAGEQRDLGMLYLRLDRPAEAIVPLQNYLASQPDDASEIDTLVRASRRDSAMRN